MELEEVQEETKAILPTLSTVRHSVKQRQGEMKMDLESAFWYVFHRMFKWRPIVMGCCDCKATYYLSKNKVVYQLKNNDGEDEPVIECPHCGLEHLVLFIRLDSNVASIKWEIVIEEPHKEAHECQCGSSGLYPEQPCRSFCYMTEMMAKGWQECPHLESDIISNTGKEIKQ